ncbi:HNH endonuclease signature motif containing protein [Cronobacter sakazakii]|uniref:HNH endonuclease signature motif containing protein n=3 Tax=Enterobacterales TaxID=91347 RepID=UPI0006D1FDB7|nr:HNH endonuclease signature motif containing protein [Cronobacter sakazakii]EMC4142370.1 HNH endonuclease [Cronobacter sakazakii]EMC4234719.1 HNH endonuclease [Cronobacter sakazakii]EMC4247059.1 HNH endonuclease [Cronobacter sakazakii]EMC4251188.1 HNH endonuclease [Cronobacter sakazakii]EMC4255494.1 HNH endonuclease [Cronobacter sakazakii]
MNDISIEYLKEALEYTPDSGVIRWKQRPKNHFKTDNSWRATNANFAGKVAGARDNDGYFRIGIDGRLYRSHRVAWALHYGYWPENEIDHISGDRGDNRIDNLRTVTSAANNKNLRLYSTNKTGVPGVGWYKARGKWRAKINVSGKVKHIGYFDDFCEAVKARKAAEMKLQYHENHGAGDRLTFLKGKAA